MSRKSAYFKYFTAVIGTAVAIAIPLSSNAAENAIKAGVAAVGSRSNTLQLAQAAKPGELAKIGASQTILLQDAQQSQFATVSPSRSIAIGASQAMKPGPSTAINAARTILPQHAQQSQFHKSQFAAISPSRLIAIGASQAMKPGPSAAMDASRSLAVPKMQFSTDRFGSPMRSKMPMGMIASNSLNDSISPAQMSDKEAASIQMRMQAPAAKRLIRYRMK